MIARLRAFAWFLGFCVLVLPSLAKLGAQQSPKPVVSNVATSNSKKLDPTLPWMSEYHAPFVYQLWWGEIAACEGLPLPLDKELAVQYYQVNGPDFIPDDLEIVVYAVTYDVDQTYVAYPYIWNKALVTHEAVHLLRLWAGDPRWWDHDPRFYGKCNLRSIGPPPPNQ